MASLTMAFAPAVFAAKTTKGTTKGTGEVKAEKGGFLDWFLEGLAKESLLEVDPLLKKVEEKNGGGGGSSKKKTVSVAVPPKKNGGGFGGLFAKK